MSLGKWIRNQTMSSLHSMVLHSFIFLIDVIRWPLYTVLAKSGLWLVYDDLTDVIRVTVSTGEQRNSRLRGTEEQ